MTIQLERPGDHAPALHHDLARLVGRRATGYSLEAPFYTSREVYDLDMDAIWTKHWLFVAAEADAEEGVDYDVPTLTHVWNATNTQDSDFVARAQRGVEDPGYEPGPYSEVEGDVDAFVTWYINRVTAHLYQ